MNSSILEQFKLKAKIDYITIELPRDSTMNVWDAIALHSSIKGRLEHAPRWRDYRDDWITIHDPAISDLQYLINHFPTVRIKALEVAIDFFIKSESNDMFKLIELHDWLRSRLFPERHGLMNNVSRRKFYDHRSHSIKDDALESRGGAQSAYWQNKTRYEQIRLYIKTRDNGRPVSGPFCVRIETTLYAGGCQNAGVSHISMLCEFGDRLRRYLSRFLHVASGNKPKLKRSRARSPEGIAQAGREAEKELRRVKRNWNKYGARWAAKHGYKVEPDTTANRLIGAALKALRDDLMRLSAPPKWAKVPDYTVI